MSEKKPEPKRLTKEEFEQLCKAWNEAHADAKAKVQAAVYARNKEHNTFTALRDALDIEHRLIWKDKLE